MMKTTLLRACVATSLAATAVLTTVAPANAAEDKKYKPKFDPILPDALEERLNSLGGMILALGIFAGVTGFIIAGALMAVSMRRGTAEEHGTRLAAVMIGCITIGSASSVALFFI